MYSDIGGERENEILSAKGASNVERFIANEDEDATVFRFRFPLRRRRQNWTKYKFATGHSSHSRVSTHLHGDVCNRRARRPVLNILVVRRANVVMIVVHDTR